MLDKFNRNISYLRLSVTNKCNLRCLYCMPQDGVSEICHEEVLTEEEMIQVCKIAVELGIKKIRITGGEPLVKKNIITLLENIRKIDGIEELCLTTNGVLLNKYADDLKRVGVDRLNISIDTLNEEKFKYITRIGNLNDTLEGIKKAINLGFKRIKTNTVLIGNFNDDEIIDFVALTDKYDIDVRFIEMMPMYDSHIFTEESFISGQVVLDKIKNYKEVNSKGVAKLFKKEGAIGNFGIITPLTNHFCKECNRIRVTFDGKVKPCLHSNDELNIKNLDYDGMKEILKKAILMKPSEHDTLSYTERSKSKRNMNMIGG